MKLFFFLKKVNYFTFFFNEITILFSSSGCNKQYLYIETF